MPTMKMIIGMIKNTNPNPNILAPNELSLIY